MTFAEQHWCQSTVYIAAEAVEHDDTKHPVI